MEWYDLVMNNALIALSSILLLVAVVPYVLDVVKGKTKPRIVSWFTWGLLGVITAAASLSEHQYPAATFGFFGAFGCFLIAALGWKHGNRKFERIDIVCQVSALLGIGLWFLFDSPALAVIVVIIIDLLGCIPTLIHSWKQPHEETWLTFFLSACSAMLVIIAAESYRLTAIANPIYIVIINTIIVTLLLVRQKYAVPGMPPELKEL